MRRPEIGYRKYPGIPIILLLITWIQGFGILEIEAVQGGESTVPVGQESKVPPEPKISPSSLESLTGLWFEAVDLLQKRNYEEAKQKLREVNTKKQEVGLESLIPASDVVIRESELIRGDFAAQVDLLEMASKLAPYNWRARFALAKLHISKGNLYGFVVESLRGLKDKILDIYTLYASLNKTLEILALSLFTAFSLVILFSFVQVHRALFHDIQERLPGSLPLLPISIMGWVFLAIVLWIGGVFWFILLLSILTWGYLEPLGKRFIKAFLVFVFLLPLILLIMGITLNAYHTPYIKALRDLSYGIYSGETEKIFKEALQSDPFNPEASFSLALINKKKGFLEAAEKGYRELIERSYQLDKVYTNLGNVYYAEKKFNEAIKAYESALEENPKLFSAHYNLAQALWQDPGSSEKAAGELDQAQRLDYDRFNKIREIAGTSSHYNLVLVDEWLPRYAPFIGSLKLWQPGYEASKKIWNLFSRLDNPLYLLGVAPFSWWILIKALDRFQRKTGYAYYCEMCGDPICKYCQQGSGTRKLCTSCSYIFAKRGVVKPGKREEKIRQVKRYEQARRWTARITSLLLPGSGHIYLGYMGKGFVIGGLIAVLFFHLSLQNIFLYAYEGISTPNTFAVFLTEWIILLSIYVFTLRDIFSLAPRN
ncbi:MAG TPA: tetratricopeptide repeat protein [Candidatus Limnocylindrales bacterium]|nr:tetratricopeptide repeat protein [Candidatus Limnocylindrales bacterium]